MKPEQDDCLEAAVDLGKASDISFEELQRPEIIGRVENSMLEAIRRL